MNDKIANIEPWIKNTNYTFCRSPAPCSQKEKVSFRYCLLNGSERKLSLYLPLLHLPNDTSDSGAYLYHTETLFIVSPLCQALPHKLSFTR